MAKKKSEVAHTDPVIVVDELVIDQGKFDVIAIDQIRISKTNRKRFNQQALEELAANIKEIGVTQPILIRPVTPTETEPQPYEIVAGERRFRASQIAGITTIPAMCRTLSDLQAAKIQILENLQRENPHPLEEAEGYENLMLTHGYSADQLVEELKKSRSYIYGRLKLCSLAKDLRDDFLDDKFSASIALLVARIPVPAMQVKAIEEVTKPNWNGDAPSFREAKEILQRRFMLDLGHAIFDIKDSKLLAQAGSCLKCPKRTGNQPEIFSDIGTHICTDPDCFAEKTAASNHRKIADANKKGIPVIEGDAAKDYGREAREKGEVMITNSGWSFDRVIDSAQNKTAASLIDQSKLPAPVKLLVLPNGKVTELYQKTKIQELLEQAGHALTEKQAADAAQEKSTEPPSDAYLKKQEQDRVLQERADKENKFRYHLYQITREKMEIPASSWLSTMISTLARVIAVEYGTPDAELAKFYSEPIPNEDTAFAYLKKNSNESLQFSFDVLLGNNIKVNRWTIDDVEESTDPWPMLLAMARSLDIDPDQVRADLERPADATPVKRPILSLKKKEEATA